MRPLLACPEQQRIDIRQSRFAAAISKAEVFLRGDCELRGILRGCQKRARMRAFDARSTSRSNSTAAQRYSIAIIFPSVYPSISLGVVRGAGLEPVTIPYPVSRERFCLTGIMAPMPPLVSS
jgi:hypothetical protein